MRACLNPRQHVHEANLQRNPSKRSVSLSFIERRLSRLTISRRGSESAEDIRGPLGLNLLYEPSEPRIDFVFVRMSAHFQAQTANLTPFFHSGPWIEGRFSQDMEQLGGSRSVLAKRMASFRNKVQARPHSQLWLQLGLG